MGKLSGRVLPVNLATSANLELSPIHTKDFKRLQAKDRLRQVKNVKF